MKAVGYVRVSTEGQAEQGESLELQRSKIAAQAVVRDAELVEVIEDAGESAKSLARPGMERVLDLVDHGAIEAVIVLKLDRLTRSVRDLAELLERFERRGVALVSVCESLDTQTAAGRLVLNIMASVGQWEREAIGERTREVLASKKARGERVGTVPFGYCLAANGVDLVEDAQEQRTLTMIRELKDAGYTLRAIAEELNRQGLRTRRRSEWRHQYVSSMLKAAA